MHNFAWFIQDEIAVMGRPGGLNELEDDLLFLRRHGIEKVLSLTLDPIDEHQLARFSLEAVHIPIPDGSAPAVGQIDEFVSGVKKWISAGKKVVVHCGAGYGRSGTMLACYLVGRGCTSAEAIRRVRQFRPRAIETREQEGAVADYELHLLERRLSDESPDSR